MLKNKNFWIACILIVCAFLGNVIRYSYRVPKRNYCDFRVYYATGERFLHKQDIYSQPDESVTPFKYSPMFAMMFAPLSLLPKFQASIVFFTINFFLFFAILFLSARFLGVDEWSTKERWIIMILSVLFSSRFVMQVLDSGQVNLLMVALTLSAVFFANRGRSMLSGGCLALGMMVKYMPAVFIPYFLFKKKYAIVAWVLVFILIFCFLPAVYLGIDGQMHYLKRWLPSIIETSLDHGSYVDYKNQSLYSLVLRLFSKESPYGINVLNLSYAMSMAISVIMGGLMYLSVLWRPSKKGPLEQASLIEVAMLFVIMALFNPNAWMINFVSLMFAYVLLWTHVVRGKFKDKFTLGLMLAAFVVTFMLSAWLVGERVEKIIETSSNVTIGALLVFAALWRLKYEVVGATGAVARK